MLKEKPLEGEIALVTGVGRSAGIGAAICRKIARQGGNVFFAYWGKYDRETYPNYSPDDPSQIEAELKALGVRTGTMEIDLSEPESAETLFKEAEDRLGVPSILINNACHDFEIPFVNLSTEILDQHYAVNVRTVALLSREFVRRERPGTIINMTSGQSLGSMGSQKIPYTITKAGLEMMVRQLAPDLARLGIKIHAIDPGPTDSGWMTEEVLREVRSASKHGRVNTPDEVGDLIVSILTQNNPDTGKVIHAPR